MKLVSLLRDLVAICMVTSEILTQSYIHLHSLHSPIIILTFWTQLSQKSGYFFLKKIWYFFDATISFPLKPIAKILLTPAENICFKPPL